MEKFASPSQFLLVFGLADYRQLQTLDDVISRFRACSSAHTIRKHYVWMQIFVNTEEKTSVFENTGLGVDGQIRFKNATCGRRFF